MLKKFEKIEIYNINQSAVLIKWYVVIHIVAVLAVLLSSLFLRYQVLLLIIILISLWDALNRQRNFNKVVIRHGFEATWDISYLDGIFTAIEILPSTVITPYVLILHFSVINRKNQTILIFKDALGHEKYRELSVLLKISGLQKDGL